jgi:oxygen-dependent protoporphyrinogen oxidase
LWLKREGRGEGILKGFISSILKEPFRSRRSARTSTSSENPARAVLRTQINDTSVDNIIRHTFGPRIADALISSMVHGIYAADSRLVSVRAAFPVMWNALNSRGSLLWGLLSPGRKNAQLIEIERVEAEAWDALGEMGTQRKAWSIYGIKGGIETLTQELEKAIKVMGVDVRIDQAINHVDLTKEGCKVCTLPYFRNAETLIAIYSLVGYERQNGDRHLLGDFYSVFQSSSRVDPFRYWSSTSEA